MKGGNEDSFSYYTVLYEYTDAKCPYVCLGISGKNNWIFLVSVHDMIWKFNADKRI